MMFKNFGLLNLSIYNLLALSMFFIHLFAYIKRAVKGRDGEKGGRDAAYLQLRINEKRPSVTFCDEDGVLLRYLIRWKSLHDPLSQ